MQIRRTVATAAGAGVLVVSGLALAGPALAVSSAAPSPVPTVSARVATPMVTSPPTAVPAAPSRSSGAIDIPAGNAHVSTDRSGATSLEVTVLLAGGIALAGGGTVLAFRRRS